MNQRTYGTTNQHGQRIKIIEEEFTQSRGAAENAEFLFEIYASALGNNE